MLNFAAQIVQSEGRGVEHQIGGFPHRRQPPAFFGHGLLQAQALAFHGVGAAGGCVTTQDDFGPGFQKKQGGMGSGGAQMPQGFAQGLDGGAASEVHAQSQAAEVFHIGLAGQVQKFGQQSRGQTVGGKKAYVFQYLEGRAFTRAGQPGDDQQGGSGGRGCRCRAVGEEVIVCL